MQKYVKKDRIQSLYNRKKHHVESVKSDMTIVTWLKNIGKYILKIKNESKGINGRIKW